jgi:hypothetical protein
MIGVAHISLSYMNWSGTSPSTGDLAAGRGHLAPPAFLCGMTGANHSEFESVTESKSRSNIAHELRRSRDDMTSDSESAPHERQRVDLVK